MNVRKDNHTSAESEPVVVQQTYQTPVAKVWKAITDVGQMRKWYFDTIRDFRAEVGFETAFDVQCEGNVYPHLWKVTEVISQQTLAYQWRYGGYVGDSVVTWQLSETPDGPELTLTHTIHQPFPQDLDVLSRESCLAGWQSFLQNSLKAFLVGPGS